MGKRWFVFGCGNLYDIEKRITVNWFPKDQQNYGFWQSLKDNTGWFYRAFYVSANMMVLSTVTTTTTVLVQPLFMAKNAHA